MGRRKKGQIWIETVIYTLITLALIGIVLGVIKPAIDDKKDAASISQSLTILNQIDGKINDIKYDPGNRRYIEDLKITRGKMIIDGVNDTISIFIDKSAHEYSEPGISVMVGNINVTTIKNGKSFDINLKLDYSRKLNITYQSKDDVHYIQQSTSQKLSVYNNGEVGSLVNIDFSL